MSDNSKKLMLPTLLKELREKCHLPQREVASVLGIDITTYCKIEKGKYPPNKDQVVKLAMLFHANRDDLVKVWLADKLIVLAQKDEAVATDAIKLADSRLNEQSK